MNIESIKAEVEQIKANAHDPEVAHRMEKDLHFEVLTAISDGAENARELAAEALKTDLLDFPRWYA